MESSVLFQNFLFILTLILFPVSLIVLDFLLAVLISIKKKTFDFTVLPQFIATNICPYVGGLVILAFLSVYLAELSYLYYAAVAIITVKFSKEALLDKITELFTK